MQSGFKKALSSSISNHIKLSKTRHETLECLAFLIMQHGSICLWRLAAYVSTQAQTESVRAPRYNAIADRRASGPCLFRQAAPCAGGLPPPLDHRDYVRQSENEGIQHGGHAYHGSGQTLDPDGGAGAFRGDGCQNRRRGCAFETRSGQKTWPQGVIAVCSRPAYLAQNLRNSQSCSNIPFFKADVISKNAAKTSEIHGDMKGSLVRCCRP